MKGTRVRIGFGLLLAFVLGLAVLLVESGRVTLLTWTERVFPVSSYRWLLALYFAGWLAAAWAPSRHRRVILLVASLMVAAVVSAGFTALLLVWVTVYHRVLATARLSTRGKLAFVVATFAAWVIGCNAIWFSGLHANHPWIPAYGYLFAVGLTFRICYAFHELRLRDFEATPFVDFLLYFFFAPFFVCVPYMMAIPRLDTFRAGLEAPAPSVERAGLRALAAGLALSTVAGLVVAHANVRGLFVQLLREGRLVVALPVGILYYPGQVVLETVAASLVLLGLIRIYGVDLAPPFRNPLAATSVTEWWRRWNVHFRDFLVDLFYHPVVLRLRRRGPYLPLVAGTVSVFLVGSTFFHWLAKHYFAFGSHHRAMWGTIAENAAMTILVAGSLCLEKRRALRGVVSPAPTGGFGLLRRRLTTYTLVFASVVVVGYGASYLSEVAPFERAHAAVARAHALYDAGRVDEARAVATPWLEPLAELVRREPREKVRRADYDFVLNLSTSEKTQWTNR